jgi:CheY-like chemotaxis protein
MPKQKKILLIDDDSSILEVVDFLLSLEGYTVLKAKEGEKGLRLAELHKPDLIILDINMPGMSGYMVSSLLSKNEKLKDIPVILLTGTAQIAGSITLDVPGVLHKLSKPFSNEKLLKIVAEIAPLD